MRSNIYHVVLALLIILLSSSTIFAQRRTNSDNRLYDDYLLDNNRPDNNSGGYYVINKTDSLKWQSPTAAFFKSMFFPGWGQLGNRQYIKAGIVIGAEVTLLGTMVHYFKTTSDAKKAFDLALLGDDDILIDQTFNAFDQAKENRNLFTWLSGFFVFLSMFDAYVDAHMAHFPKYDKKISLQINSEDQEEVTAELSFRF